MTKSEAEQRCRQLAEGHPERDVYRWDRVQLADGSWQVAKVELPPTPKGKPEVLAADKSPIRDNPESVWDRIRRLLELRSAG